MNTRTLPILFGLLLFSPSCPPGEIDGPGPDDDTSDDDSGDDDTGDDDTGDDDTGDDDTGDDDTGDDDTGDDDYDVCGDGNAPFDDIQEAVEEAADGDTIRICAGTYGSVEIVGRSVSLLGVDGAAVTTIEGGQDSGVFVEDSTLELAGLTMTGRAASWTGGGVTALTSSLVVQDCVVSGVTASDHPSYGAYLSDTDATWERVVFEDNAIQSGVLGAFDDGSLVIVQSVFRRNGDLVMSVGGPDATIHNNLMVDNSCDFVCVNLAGNPATVWVYNNTIVDTTMVDTDEWVVVVNSDTVEFVNNIVADSNGQGVLGYTGSVVDYNDSWGHAGDNFYEYVSGANNLEANPHLTDPDNGDYHLDPGFSPCVDAGSPLPGYDDPDGSRNDMGAYGGPYGSWP